jgi:DNA-binding beta-propeller fold protein YncE
VAAGSVSVIRTFDDSVVATIPVPGAPGALDILPNDSFLYIAHEDTGLISVIRTTDDSCVARVHVNGPALDVAAGPDGQNVYVACGTTGDVAVIRTSDNTVAFTAAIGGKPTDIRFSPSGETAYVACPSSDAITLMRTSDVSVLGRVNQDSMGMREPRALDILSNGQCLYTICMNGVHLGILRRSDNYLLRLISIDPHYRGWRARIVVSHPDGSRVYVPTTSGVVVLGLRPGH